MEDYLTAIENAREELKRVDHLVYVSLKYTRTADVIKHVLARMISTIDFCIIALLEMMQKKGKIENIPTAPTQRAELVRDLFKKDEQILKIIDLFLLLKRIDRAKYTKSQEFRRHVAMTANLENGVLYEINIDKVTEYYQELKGFVEYVSEMVK